ncbi:hypothetical protein G9A89_015650 [Geosiphon pyriformis]|nr:hypothetical protein G9A89_015650 [Geosiphon pyriformis]
MGTNAHDIWDFVKSVGGKTYVIDCHSVTYAWARCAVVCFDSAESLDAGVRTTPVLRNTNFHWSRLISAKCAKYEKLGHTLLSCVVGGKFSSGNSLRRAFSDMDKSRLAAIYAKHSALIARPVSFGDNGFSLEIKPSLLVTMEVNNRFAALECSLVCLAEQVGKLAKRLDALGPMVLQPSPGCQPLVTPLSQDQGADVVMSESSGVSTSGGTVIGVVSFNMSSVSKLEDSMRCLMEMVLGLLAKVDSIGVHSEDVIRWHKEMNNLVSIVTETKLRMFTSGSDFGHLGVDIAVIMNISLAHHVCKVSEVPGWLLSVKLLFKNKLSVSILGLYAGASPVINSLIAKTVNESFFIVLGGDFNEDGFHKCASFRKCFDLGLANSLVESLAVKLPTWANSRSIKKTIDYMLVSSNLVNVIVHRSVLNVGEHFETDHQAVSVSLGLGGLLDMQLNSFHKQVNRNHWKFNFKDADDVKWNKFKGAITANAIMFFDDFIASQQFSDLDAMWNIVCKIMVLLANKDYDSVFTKESSKFHKLELLISKLVKAFWSICHDEFISLLEVWGFLDNDNTSVVRSLFLSSSPLNTVWSALSKIRKTYCLLKMAELKHRMESFKLNKSHTIRSILKCSSHKVVLDHLVVDNKLVIELSLVRSRVDEIIEGWTRKHRVVPNVPDVWHHQYWPLDYIFDEAFSGIMQPIEFLELFGVVSDLPVGKAAGLLGISNELWMHSNRSVLDMLLVLLNFCLSHESVSGVLTNTRPIALIETAHKILSKILSNRILLACSAHNILHGDNFSVLKSTTTQTPIFAIGLVVENALEKNWKLWLHLEKCLVRIKMCSKFIHFFGNIHRNRTNRVMMNFSLTNGYSVHNGLNQGEVFSLLLWHIFYDPLLCEIKYQKSVCGYRLNSHFVSRNGFGSSQTATQHILNVASEFLQINDISINNDKTVVIPINSRISNSSLFISGSPIFIAKKGKSHQYLGIFLSSDGLSKPSLAKAHSDVHFFSNLVLKKMVSDKQFLYLVLAVLHPIVSYRTQFSFILVSVCNKWNALICKSLKLKSGLPLNFPSDMIHHSSFYGLKSFSQCQSYDLQVLCWHPVHPLSSSACIRVSVSNNFLSGMVRILLRCNLSLGGSLASSFWFRDGVSISAVLSKSLFFKYLPSLQHYGIAFKKLDPCGPVPKWFKRSVVFLNGASSFSLASGGVGPMDICGSDDFVSVCDYLFRVSTDSLSVYTDGSVKNLGMAGCRAGAAAFFEDINLGLGVCVQGLMSFILVELQAVVLALKCMPVDCSVCLFSDSQAALDACKSEVNLMYLDFRNWCWVEHWHIRNIIHRKNLRVSWHKIKGHSGVLGNDCANSFADTTAFFVWLFPSRVDEHFLLADGDVFCAVCWARWKVGSSSGFLAGDLHSNVNWLAFSRVWHPDLHMATGFTSRHTADICTYLMKALHRRLPVAVQKRIYDKCYSSVLCLYCGEVEVSDHVFSCIIDDAACRQVLESCMSFWMVLSGLSFSSSSILQLLSTCALDFLVFSALCKNFEAVSIFCDPKIAGIKTADFVHSICVAFRDDIWLVHAKHHAYMEKNDLILVDGSVPISLSGLASRFSDDMVKLLGVTEAFGVRFGFRKSCSFFSDIGNPVLVNIIV